MDRSRPPSLLTTSFIPSPTHGVDSAPPELDRPPARMPSEAPDSEMVGASRFVQSVRTGADTTVRD